ncbi:TIGR00730 family Rossman fold protein [Piscinibacter gummiphilus]|uniref:Cytokinin riboside 5'-monophosphate phosphoribohydrolase n=1 Tax=Piscinibacter gummiphilus TaxID=946333 RepID=A0A1W6L807_9BURK|nr:TIGR00730 family Rossman fold protein [Piscinibacter gummiphilus]ARN20337.1 Rossman fold protein, TIGR00730 family [Piscinibacter gummiphilus]ATU65009.1 TIGR00730 family Rossman fold protein [Piscinibacter gummiphilus]GLS98609.1 putative cytokinin riboside 5'-monophosphate phosphoribohydrolase [Piscinibacter gummiphilus]
MRTLCVYCGSSPGTDPAFADAARAVGTLIGREGWQLVYGGGRAGLMGIVADAALAAGAPVIGVIPESLMARELGHPGLTELHVVETMHQRKTMMAERADAFVALPGGIGTFEELFEVWTWRQLGYHDKPVGLLNVAGYYDALLAFLDQSTGKGFMRAAQHELLQVHTDPRTLLARLGVMADGATAPDDYRLI